MLIMLNCHNYAHAENYDRFDVFFDLDIDRHAEEKGMLYPDAICCVISYENLNDKSGNVVLSFWRFKQSLEDKSRKARALIGQRIGAMTMAKSELASHPEFEDVIAVDGDFNRFSVMKST